MSGIKRTKYDATVSDLVRESVGYCEHCGESNKKLEAAHVWSRRHKSIRYDLDNLLCLCFTCHSVFTGSPIEFTRWCETHLGNGHLELLQEKKNEIKRWKQWELDEMRDFYRAQLKAVRAMRDQGTTGRIEVESYQ